MADTPTDCGVEYHRDVDKKITTGSNVKIMKQTILDMWVNSILLILPPGIGGSVLFSSVR